MAGTKNTKKPSAAAAAAAVVRKKSKSWKNPATAAKDKKAGGSPGKYGKKKSETVDSILGSLKGGVRRITSNGSNRSNAREKQQLQQQQSEAAQQKKLAREKKKVVKKIHLPAVISSSLQSKKNGSLVPWMLKQQQPPPSSNCKNNNNNNNDDSTPRRSNKSNTSSNNTNTGWILPTRAPREAVLDALDEELRQFATFVQLDDPEVRARRDLVQHFEQIARQLFAAPNNNNKNKNRHVRFLGGVPYQQPQAEIRCRVFGSFATLPVCTFQSDVDLALWGVVPTPHVSSLQGAKTETAAAVDPTGATTTTASNAAKNNNNNNKKRSLSDLKLERARERQQKKERWLELLDACNETAIDGSSCSDGNTKPAVAAVHRDERQQKKERWLDLVGACNGAANDSKNDNKKKNDSRSAVEGDAAVTAGDMFVIDRMGDPSVAAAAANLEGANVSTTGSSSTISENKKEESEKTKTAQLPPLVMKGTLSFDLVPQRRHLIRGMWNYENSNTSPPQRFELIHKLAPEEDEKKLPVDGEFYGTFSMAYVHTTSKGKQKERSKVIPETGVKIKFTPIDGSNGAYNVDGKGTNKFGVFHINGKATPSADPSDPTMNIVLRKRYEPGPVVAPDHSKTNNNGTSNNNTGNFTAGTTVETAIAVSDSPLFKTTATGKSIDSPIDVEDDDDDENNDGGDDDTDGGDSADPMEAFVLERGESMFSDDPFADAPDDPTADLLLGVDSKLSNNHAKKRRRTDGADEAGGLVDSGYDSEEEIDNDDDGDDGDDDETILDAVEVGFFTTGATRRAAPKSFGPTGWVRSEVVSALGSFTQKLRKSKLTRSVYLIKGARVPIIKVDTCLGIETDIAVGGHNGTDTSLYAAAQVEAYQSFSAVVLFLKTLLAHQSLDAPFTGGLGSYKLYVLVAHHLKRHLALGGSDRPGEIVLSFLYRYGMSANRRGYRNQRHCTALSQHVPLEGPDGGSADLSNVFRLDECIELFRQCWERLWDKVVSGSDAPNQSHQQSFLADLISTDRLGRERKMAREQLRATVSRLHEQHRRLTASNNNNNYASSSRQQESRGQPAAVNNNNQFAARPRGDLTAEQIAAGYGANEHTFL